MPLHLRILVGFVLGALGGAGARALFGDALTPFVDNVTEPAGKLFLRALLIIVVPLVFASLVLGVNGLGDLRKLGRVGAKTLAYTLVVSAISVVVGLVTANVVRPGERLSPETRASLVERYAGGAKDVADKAQATSKPFGQSIVDILPDNIVAAVAKSPPDMLGLMIFALFFGVALALIPRDRSKALLDALDGVFEATSTMIRLVMAIAPLGVFCLLFTMTARFGFALLSSLALYVACVLGALLFQQVVVYSAILKLLANVSPVKFFRRIEKVMLTAFSTSSSNATLPTALKSCEEDLGVPREIGSFVLTVGATANQNGTALFEGVTILFLAQVFGVDLTLGQQGLVLLLAVVSGIGTAGVPSGSIPFIAVVLGTVGVPVEGIAIILGVDRFLDMCRTVLNVTGDMAAAVVVAKSEGATPLAEAAPAA